jgi:hypothetical protein
MEGSGCVYCKVKVAWLLLVVGESVMVKTWCGPVRGAVLRAAKTSAARRVLHKKKLGNLRGRRAGAPPYG